MPEREIDQTKLGKTTRRGLTFWEIPNVLWNLGTQTNYIILNQSSSVKTNCLSLANERVLSFLADVVFHYSRRESHGARPGKK